MADEKVTYRYVGDSSSLKKASKEAEDSLSSYESATKKADSATSEVNKSFKSLTDSTSKLSNSFKSLNTATSFLGKTFQALVGFKIGDVLSEGAKSAIAYVENVNLFNVAMGESVEIADKFVNRMAEIYGMDPSNLYRTSGLFYQLTDAIGMTDKASASLSLSMTKMSNDIASLFNVDVETVTTNLASGMQGMSRAVRKYGMDIRATTLQQTAYTYGLTEQVGKMSESNRMALRYLTMLDQVRNATQQMGKDVNGSNIVMGDFARNIETPANQLRIFKEQMSQLGRAIGDYIVVPLSKAIAYVNGFVMALRMAISFVSSLLGIINVGAQSVDMTNAADSVASVGDAASNASKKVKALIAPFDELNVLQESSGSGGASGGGMVADVLDPNLEKAILDAELSLENFRMKALDVRDAILEFFGFEIDGGKIISWDSEEFEQNLIDKFPQWTKTIQTVFAEWSNIVNGFKKLFSSIGEVIGKVVKKIKDFFSLFINDTSVSNFITSFSDGLNGIANWISEHTEEIANFTLIVLGLVAAFKAFTFISSLIPIFSTFATTLGALLNPITLVGIALGVMVADTIMDSTELQQSLVGNWNSIIDSTKRLGASFSDTWNNHLGPFLQNFGQGIVDTYENHVKPTLEQIVKVVGDIVADLIEDITNFWELTVAPILNHITDGLNTLWENTVKPVIDNAMDIIGKLGELIGVFWDRFLGPLVDRIVNYFGPMITDVVNFLWDTFQTVFQGIGGVVKGFLEMLEGVIDFIVGVFTGDWNRAFSGLLNVFVGFGNALISVFETAVNFIIDLVNALIIAVFDGVKSLINDVLGTVEGIADFLGFDLDLVITARPPTIPLVHFGRIPTVELATGGVVTSPTSAVIGEGAYDEAVIPLGNSPQMKDLVQEIASAVNGQDSTPAPIEVHVYLGGKEVDAEIYRASKRGEKMVGAQPITIGG